MNGRRVDLLAKRSISRNEGMTLARVRHRPQGTGRLPFSLPSDMRRNTIALSEKPPGLLHEIMRNGVHYLLRAFLRMDRSGSGSCPSEGSISVQTHSILTPYEHPSSDLAPPHAFRASSGLCAHRRCRRHHRTNVARAGTRFSPF